jgi:hypothetical protein
VGGGGEGGGRSVNVDSQRNTEYTNRYVSLGNARGRRKPVQGHRGLAQGRNQMDEVVHVQVFQQCYMVLSEAPINHLSLI